MSRRVTNSFSLPAAGWVEQVLGVSQIYKAQAHHTAGGLVCVEVTVPPCCGRGSSGAGYSRRQAMPLVGAARRKHAVNWQLVPGCIFACWLPIGSRSTREAEMAVASVSKITAASPTSFDAAVQEGLARASKTLRGITGLHVIEEKASVRDGQIDEYRVTMEVTFILEN